MRVGLFALCYVYDAIRTPARARHRERAWASLADGPAASWVIRGAVAVVIVGLIATIATQVVVAYGIDAARGRTVLVVAAASILLIVLAIIAAVGIVGLLQRVRVDRVRRETRDIVYVGRILPGFDDAIRCFSGTVNTRDDVYCFTIGSSGIRIWTGFREPTMVAAIHWTAIESVHLDRTHSRTAGHWAARVVSSADPSIPLMLVPIERFARGGTKRRTTTALRQMRWHLIRRHSY